MKEFKPVEYTGAETARVSLEQALLSGTGTPSFRDAIARRLQEIGSPVASIHNIRQEISKKIE